MRSLLIALCLLSLVGCAGFAVEKHASPDFDGVSYKTVEIYKHNAFGPSFAYTMLFQCDADGRCAEMQRTPNVTPGFVSSLVAPVIQAGAILGGAVLIGDGLRDSASTTNTSLNTTNSSVSVSNPSILLNKPRGGR